MTTTDHDYETEGPEGDITGTCHHCNRPIYATPDGSYHHAVNAAEGCFLIGPEVRADDTAHPLYRQYVTFDNQKVSLSRDEYHATITANDLDTLFRLYWTDGVVNDWTEDYYSLAAALCRLAALEFCADHDRTFLTDAATYNSQAHNFLASVTD